MSSLQNMIKQMYLNNVELSGGVTTGGRKKKAGRPRKAGRPKKAVAKKAVAKRTGRKLSVYQKFVRDYAKKHPGLGKNLISKAANAWRNCPYTL